MYGIARTVGGMVLVAAMGGVMVAPAGGAPYVALGPADSIAIDQPRVVFGLVEPGTSNLVGPVDYNYAALDTGSNGVLLAALAYVGGESYQQAMNGSQPVYYTETGVVGATDLAVLVPYDLVFEGTDTDNEITIGGVRALGDEELDLGGFAGVVGMPAMAGRVVGLDLTAMSQLELIGVDFAGAASAVTADSYHVALSMMAPTFSGVQSPTDPLPTYGALPLLEARAAFGGGVWSGAMLADTGAQNSFISSDVAEALGIDYTHGMGEGGDVIDVLPVGGVGGSAEIPLVRLGSVAVATVEGVDLIWSDVLVGVVDLPGVAGVFGMNMLTSGYGEAVLGGLDVEALLGDPNLLDLLVEYGLLDSGGDTLAQLLSLVEMLSGGSSQPCFQRVEFDFSGEGEGSMRLDLYPEVNQVLPEPTTVGALWVLGGLALVGRRGSRRGG